MKIVEVFSKDYDKILDRLIRRGDEDFLEVDRQVYEILSGVKSLKDEALVTYTQKFDGANLTNLKVSDKEIEDAIKMVDTDLIEIMKEAASNIREYHQLQKEKTWLDRKSVV